MTGVCEDVNRLSGGVTHGEYLSRPALAPALPAGQARGHHPRALRRALDVALRAGALRGPPVPVLLRHAGDRCHGGGGKRRPGGRVRRARPGPRRPGSALLAEHAAVRHRPARGLEGGRHRGPGQSDAQGARAALRPQRLRRERHREPPGPVELGRVHGGRGHPRENHDHHEPAGLPRRAGRSPGTRRARPGGHPGRRRPCRTRAGPPRRPARPGRVRAIRRRAAHVHLGHDRRPQGRHEHPRQRHVQRRRLPGVDEPHAG